MEAKISSLLHELDTLGDNKPSNTLLTRVTKALRKSKVRRPDIFVKYGRRIISLRISSSAEMYSLYEQVYVAALEFNDFELADICLVKLKKQFSGSSRVKRLEAMRHEATGEFEEAMKIYDAILTENPVNLLVLKRKVAIYKAKGNINAAIDALNEILKTYQSDIPSWLEMCDIYISLCQFESAAFCMEEIILLAPMNPIFQTRLAEIYYSCGGAQNFLKARKHYATSLNIHNAEYNARALYGLLATCKVLSAAKYSKQIPPKEVEVNTELFNWAQEQLAARCNNNNKNNNQCYQLIRTMFEQDYKGN